MKTGVNSVLFSGFDLETAMQHISWAGYDGIELSAIQGMCEHLNLDTWKEDAAKIKALAAQYNLELLAIELASLDENRIVRSCQAAAELGIPVVNTASGGASNQEGCIEQSIETLAKYAETAASCGVTICMKAHVGAAVYNTPTTLQVMKVISSQSFGIDMDPSHIYRAGENPVEALKQVISRVRHIHIRDCRNKEGSPGAPEDQACGRGNIDLPGYIKVLHDAGYTGPVNLEIIGAHEYALSRCATIAAESRGYLNACVKMQG